MAGKALKALKAKSFVKANQALNAKSIVKACWLAGWLAGRAFEVNQLLRPLMQ